MADEPNTPVQSNDEPQEEVILNPDPGPLEHVPTLDTEILDADHSRVVELRKVENVMEDSYLRYSMSVIVARALPDVRDGLKPVHRRILYVMYQLKNFWNRPYLKSARIV